MRKIAIIIAVITFAIFGLMFYQYRVQKQEAVEFDVYQTVLDEKTVDIYKQAQDWSKPISIDTKDVRLDSDFQIMADFMLQMMVRNAELRNSYLRELKDVGWDKFLDIHRLEKDKQSEYVETEAMLKQVGLMVNLYQQNLDQHKAEIQNQIKELPIKARFRRYLTETLVKRSDMSSNQALFELEKQSYVKAQKIFEILKSNQWKIKNNTFMFEDQKVVNDFNRLYKEIVALDRQMKQVSKSTKKELEKAI